MSDCSDGITVRRSAVDWLKEHYPALCEKAGLCERVGRTLYTVVLPEPSQPSEGGKPVAWMRVIHSSDGRPVLFYIERDAAFEGSSIIHCYVRFDGFDMDLTMEGIPTEKVETALSKLSQKEADTVINQAKLFAGGSDE